MTPLSPADAKADALARFADQGPGHLNCNQAILRYALLVKGYDPDLVKVGQFFGGGMAGMGEICGAVSGCALSLGLREYESSTTGDEEGGPADPETPPMPDRLQELMRGFAAEFGALRCRDLTGHDLTTPKGRDDFHASEDSRRCADFVSWSIDRVTPLLLGS